MRNSRSGMPGIFILVLLIAAGTTAAFGSGFSIFEQGAKATGMGGAFTATADDPSAMFYNVAGIAYQRHLSVLVGGTAINFNNEFRGEEGTFPGPQGTAHYQAHTFIPPNTYAVVPIGENLSFGIGAFSAFGLRTDWANNDTFSGRFISQDANLKTVSIQPSLAWKTSNGKFAIGAGYEYRTATITLDRNVPAINPFTQRIVDVVHARLASDRDHDTGFTAGLIFAPTDTLRFGASYRTSQDIKFGGNATFTQIPTGNAQLDGIIKATRLPPAQGISATLPFPSMLSAGVATTAIPNWTVEFDYNRAEWSRFKSLDVAFDVTPANNLSVAENWKDSSSYRIGANHPVTENWDVRLGAVYDESPQPMEAVGPLLPDSDRIGVSFGLGYASGPWRLEATEFVLHFMDRNTLGRNDNQFNGTYKTSANLIGLNIGYVF